MSSIWQIWLCPPPRLAVKLPLGLWQGVPHAHLNQTVKCHSLPLPYSLLSAKAKPSNPLIFFLYIYFKGTCTPLLWINHLYGQVKKGYCHLLQAQSSTCGVRTADSAVLVRPSVVSEKACSHAVFYFQCLDPAVNVHFTSEPCLLNYFTLIFDLFNSCHWTGISLTYPSHYNPESISDFMSAPRIQPSLFPSRIRIQHSLPSEFACEISPPLQLVAFRYLFDQWPFCLLLELWPPTWGVAFLICPSFRSTALFTFLGRLSTVCTALHFESSRISALGSTCAH